MKYKSLIILICLGLGVRYLSSFWGEEHTHEVSQQIHQESEASLAELDEIYSLLNYSIVYKNWQDHDRKGRGYNVGAILVDKDKHIVDYALNSVNLDHNATQHGEVILLSKYLNSPDHYSLNGYSVYVSLEPCAMCAGMMSMVSLDKTVNGQTDRYFGKALERLALNSKDKGGYAPYPRTVKSILTTSPVAKKLDESFHAYIKQGNKPILTKFLSTPEAKAIYEEAEKSFLSFEVKNGVNKKRYQEALDFYKNL